MKIAIVHNLPSGGGKRALYEFTRLLYQRGYALDVYTLSLADKQFLPLAPYINRVKTSDIHAFRLIQTRLLPFLLQYLNLPRKLAYLRKLHAVYRNIAQDIDRQDYDLVFVHHCRVLQSPYILRYLKTPGVYYCQEPPRRLYEPVTGRKQIMTMKQKIQTMWYAPATAIYGQKVKRDDYVNARSSSLVLVNSYFSRESVYRVYGINARVSYLGVDPARFTPQNGIEKEHLVISVGRTYPEKGYDFIIQALSHIPPALRPQLLIVADMRDSVEERNLTTLAHSHGVKFTIVGGISDAELVRWYRKAKLLVYAPIMEPFGLAPLEAMACGIPVVAVKEGGVRESVHDQETGFLTQRDHVEFGEKIRILLENSDIQTRYGWQARQHVERSWTWEHSVEELLENFQRAIR